MELEHHPHEEQMGQGQLGGALRALSVTCPVTRGPACLLQEKLKQDL